MNMKTMDKKCPLNGIEIKEETVYSAAPVPEKAAVLEKEAETGNLVTSPLVGTFYAAPAEDSRAFCTGRRYR